MKANAGRRDSAVRFARANWELTLLCLPALVAYILFQYMPMGGLVLAFKTYRYSAGLFGSPWAGLKNFDFLLRSVDLLRIVRNTVGYSLLFMIIGPLVNIGTALLLFEIDRRGALKAYQTIITFPNFMSWVIVGFITYAILNPAYGALNGAMRALGMPEVDVYTMPSAWPFILTIVNCWKGVGMGSMMYLAVLMGIDPALYEAATIDGASRLQQTRHISVPSLTPLLMIMTIMAVGGMFSGDFGLFYQISRNVSILYETTDIIDTYVFRGLQSASFGMSSAVGLIQSVIGLILVGATNWVVARISPENAMF